VIGVSGFVWIVPPVVKVEPEAPVSSIDPSVLAAKVIGTVRTRAWLPSNWLSSNEVVVPTEVDVTVPVKLEDDITRSERQTDRGGESLRAECSLACAFIFSHDLVSPEMTDPVVVAFGSEMTIE
jgi:hypothetical protein